MPGRDSSALRVVHVVPSLNVAIGGPARSVMRLASAQQRLGVSVCVVSGDGEQVRTHDAAKESTRDLEIRRCRHLPLPFEFPDSGMVRVLEKEIGGADLVHLHSLWNGTITAAARIARKSGVPYVISPRGMLCPAGIRQRQVLKRLYRALVDRPTSDAAAGIHFLTPHERDSAVWPPHAGQRTVVIPNGIEAEAVHRAAGSFSPELFANGGPNLLYLGRLHLSKGLALQVDALRLLKAKNIDADLFFIGPDDGEAAALKHHARASGFGDRVHVLAPEYSDRRFGLLKQADCVLLTSHFEGNSVSAMETMAVGGLLIATDTTHLDEAARHDAAIVVKRDATQVAEAIARVLENPEFGKSLRRHAVDYARTHLESAVIARRMLNFYDELLGMAFAVRASA